MLYLKKLENANNIGACNEKILLSLIPLFFFGAAYADLASDFSALRGTVSKMVQASKELGAVSNSNSGQTNQPRTNQQVARELGPGDE